MLPLSRPDLQGELAIKTLSLFAIIFLISSCTKKPKEVDAFCSTMKGNHVKIEACHWQGKISMSVEDHRPGSSGKPMVIWNLDAKSGNVNLFNVPQKRTSVNPLATHRDELRLHKDDMKLFLQEKKQMDESIERTGAVPGKSEGNFSEDTDCKWYIMKDPKPNEEGRFDNVCIAPFGDSFIKAYMEMIDSVKSLDQQFYPISIEGMPLLNWRMPFHKPDGWLEKGHLPKVFVTGPPGSTETSLQRMDFSYEIRKMNPDDLIFKPDWEQSNKNGKQ